MSGNSRDRLTDAELKDILPKSLKDPRVTQIYRDLPFLEAYAKHTDLRVQQGGPAAAVGSAEDWEKQGDLQCAFLLRHGIRPSDSLLEYGCGTGRLARKIVPYLDEGNYVGVDISKGALAAAREIAKQEGWDVRHPFFTASPPQRTFDYVWSFSVSIHLPTDALVAMLRACAARMRESSQFFMSFVPEKVEVRTGLKQFRHTAQTYYAAISTAGLEFTGEAKDWNGGQHMAILRLLR